MTDTTDNNHSNQNDNTAETLTLQEQSRVQIAEFLPGAIARALTSYFAFSKASPDEQECKDFAARHNAAKAAISHIELLVKLAKWADLPDPALENADENDRLSRLIESATKEISGALG
ncbi:MAG: hypothetical protein ACK4VI_01175 [Alphaproteobacteria bacterium]